MNAEACSCLVQAHEESISVTGPDLKLTNVQGVAPINLHLCFIEATMQNPPRAEIKDEDHILFLSSPHTDLITQPQLPSRHPVSSLLVRD